MTSLSFNLLSLSSFFFKASLSSGMPSSAQYEWVVDSDAAA
eukprot:CAMPEP_0172042156 /NCGR_PEP_ID=MMETSP1041-20130122/25517_1 /TAXON_ID=464988 /ORGANISM="Hemiselmis andersenii, Strain CCMP439" /LENGTH=40 /DNA_ID= /DNA_START= /DNA_END= /DNA_ORIENTATION=